MSFELKKEEASSLIFIPHLTYCCLTSRQSLYSSSSLMFLWKALPGLPSFASLIVYSASTLPSVIALWSSTTGHQHCFVIASCHHSVEQYYGAPTCTHCHCTVALYYWAPTLLQHHPLSLHGRVVLWGTNMAST